MSRTMVFSDVFGANRGRGIVFRGGVFGAEGWFRLLTGLVSACDALVGGGRRTYRGARMRRTYRGARMVGALK